MSSISVKEVSCTFGNGKVSEFCVMPTEWCVHGTDPSRPSGEVTKCEPDAHERQCDTERSIASWRRTSETSRHPEMMPDVGVIAGTATAALVPDATNFPSGREFAAWRMCLGSHYRFEVAEPNGYQLLNVGLPTRVFVNYREPL